jgi:hypothetical protein
LLFRCIVVIAVSVQTEAGREDRELKLKFREVSDVNPANTLSAIFVMRFVERLSEVRDGGRVLPSTSVREFMDTFKSVRWERLERAYGNEDILLAQQLKEIKFLRQYNCSGSECLN